MSRPKMGSDDAEYAAVRPARSAGIANLGNSGWLSAVLQCLAHTDPVRDYFLATNYRKDLPPNRDSSMADAFAAILEQMWHQDEAVRPGALLAQLHRRGFVGQQDHHAVLIGLLDALMEETNRITDIPYLEAPPQGQPDAVAAREWWDNHRKRMDCPLADMFQWQIKSRGDCGRCGASTARFEPVQCLQLPVPEGAANATLADCLETYTSAETLPEVYCAGCKDFTESRRRVSLYRSPPILVVHLKRYKRTPRGPRKISAPVEFPLEGLDLAEHFLKKDGEKEPIYDCYAVCNHTGTTNGGSYTAHVLEGDGTWSLFQDAVRTEDVPSEKVVSPAAYVLYYRRRDVPSAQSIVRKSIGKMDCRQRAAAISAECAIQ